MSFSMMSQHLMHAGHATLLEPTVCPPANSNNCTDIHTNKHAYTDAQTKSNDSADSHDVKIGGQNTISPCGINNVLLSMYPSIYQMIKSLMLLTAWALVQHLSSNPPPQTKELLKTPIQSQVCAVVCSLDPVSAESNDQVERLQICSRQHLLLECLCKNVA